MDDALAYYSFLPWLRQGISNKINELDNLGANIQDNSLAKERPEITVRLKLNENQIRKDIKLHGPGDVIGINNDAFLREYPKAGTNDFESNVLAYIEFYEEDFPWRYTPALQTSTKLRPWLALIVLKEEEYSFNVYGNGLPVVSIDGAYASKVFPNHQETWAWAHVHINKTMSSTTLESDFESDLKANPDMAYSRLMCPRKLERAEGGIKYHAFLIPAFETGRLAGLGEDPGDIYAQQSSWISGGQPASSIRPFDFPVYYNWEFKTGEFGDFETLVSILKAQPAGDRFGKRDMSIQQPGFGLDGVAQTDTLGLEGALKPPGFESDIFPQGIKDEEFIGKLKDILNVSQDLQNESTKNSLINPFHGGSQNNAFYTEKIADDPIVTPPLYAKWQALKQRLQPGMTQKQWFNELNLDPRHRATAAVGSQVVMKNQEKYMEEAWKQIGEINEANQKIREAELAKMVNNSIYEKRLYNLDENKLMMVTSPVQRFALDPVLSKTYEQSFTDSKIPNAAKSPAFKKIIRPGRKSIKKISKKGELNNLNVPIQQSILSRFNGDDVANPLTAAKTKKEPSMVVSTGKVEEAIKFFLLLQEDHVRIQADESLALDGPTISTQEEYSRNFTDFSARVNSLRIQDEKEGIDDFKDFSIRLRNQINPMDTIPNLIRTLIATGNNEIVEVKPIMAYPEFRESMFADLKTISQDFIIPNFSEIPENTITLLNNNQVFIESFMAGLNHEMSRELLWREYPTDQRGSYFRNFWDDKDSFDASGFHSDHDITEIHNWNGLLGTHNERIENADGNFEDKKNFVVLVIRGDLLKKYPNTVVYAHQAIFQDDHDLPRQLLVPEEDDLSMSHIKNPIFQGDLEPDVALYGFSLTEAEVRGNAGDAGWFFVLKERPGQINFGMDDFVSDDPDDNTITIPQENADSWNNLSWGHLVPENSNLDDYHQISLNYVRANASGPTWGADSANMASILYQNPMIIARHGEEMLPPVEE